MDAEKRQSIFTVIAAIPLGKVTTYGRVAEYAGLKNASRYVGTLLRSLPKQTELPWHRIINSQGKISLPENHPGRRIQILRLKEEGVLVNDGKVDLKQHLWRP